MDTLTRQIAAIEWELFDQVQNIGGRADCQDDRTTFFIMRTSQLSAWNQQMRESWLQDLLSAQAQGRNPVSEKYGYMMQRTDPPRYLLIQDALPPRPQEKMEVVDHICAIHVAWFRAVSSSFPLLSGRGRAIDKSGDSPCSTSFETYLWGELSTYSHNTLMLYLEYVEQLKQEGKNLNEIILRNTAAAYGFPSLEEAEAFLTR